MKKVLEWLNAKAPSPDLEGQLAKTKEAYEAAEVAAKAAQDLFDESGSPESEKNLRAALTARDSAKLYFEGAERVLAAAKEREAQAAREQLQRELAQVEQRIAAMRKRAKNELVAAEVDALIAVADIRVRRLELVDEIRGTLRERTMLRSRLGEPVEVVHIGSNPDQPSPYEVEAELSKRANALDPVDPRRALLRELVPTRDAYFTPFIPHQHKEPKTA